jgi:hypothetical protein
MIPTLQRLSRFTSTLMEPSIKLCAPTGTGPILLAYARFEAVTALFTGIITTTAALVTALTRSRRIFGAWTQLALPMALIRRHQAAQSRLATVAAFWALPVARINGV